MPRDRAEEAKARLAAVMAPPVIVSSQTEAEQSQADRLAELDARMEGAHSDDEASDDETLAEYSKTRLQIATLPRVELSSAELNAVYEPSDDTFLLIDALHADKDRLQDSSAPPALCVEIGCGSGVVITSLSCLLPDSRCMALDINPTALSVSNHKHPHSQLDFQGS